MVSCSLDKYKGISLEFTADKNNKILFPDDVRYEKGRNQYSVCYARFNSKTAEVMAEDDSLNEKQRVYVNIDGERQEVMYYRPEFLKIGDGSEDYEYSGFVELHDAHESLNSGSVNYSPVSADLDTVFREIFDARKEKTILTEVVTSLVEDTITIGDLNSPSKTSRYNLSGIVPFVGAEYGNIGNEPIEFDGTSPLEAIKIAKNKFGVDTAISPFGTLMVGNYMGGSGVYDASTVGYETDYHIESSSLSSPSQSVEAIQIKGPAVNPVEPGSLDSLENMHQTANPYVEEENYRIYVTVRNPNVESGVRKQYSLEDGPKENEKLVELGKRYFRGFDMEVGKGNVTLNINTSNKNHKEAPLRIGDTLQIKIPPNECLLGGSSPMYGDYAITGVSHKVNTSWKVDVDVARPLVSIDELDVKIEFYDTLNEQSYTHEELYGYPRESSEIEM